MPDLGSFLPAAGVSCEPWSLVVAQSGHKDYRDFRFMSVVRTVANMLRAGLPQKLHDCRPRVDSHEWKFVVPRGGLFVCTQPAWGLSVMETEPGATSEGGCQAHGACAECGIKARGLGGVAK